MARYNRVVQNIERCFRIHEESDNLKELTFHTIKDWPMVQYDQGWRGELCGLSWSQPDGKVSERWRWTSPSPAAAKAKAKAKA